MRDKTPKNKAMLTLFKSPLARIFLTVGLVLALIVATVWLIRRHEARVATESAVSISGAPSIQSIPGAGSPSEAYVKAQMQQNIAGEQAAEKSATAFVPTITRAGFVGSPGEFAAEATATQAGGVPCPVNKVVMTYKPNPESCTPRNLQLARETGVTVEELMCQGCSCEALKAAGYTIGELKKIGLTAEQLHQCGFDLQALKNVGFSAAELKNAGFSAAALKAAGFSAGELKDAGFSATELKNAGFSAKELKDAGFSTADLKSAGFSAAALKAAGFSAGELKDAGFSATELKNAGFSAKELKDAGFSTADLKSAGFSAAALKAAGFSAGELKDAGFSTADLKSAGFSDAQIQSADLGKMPTEGDISTLQKQFAADSKLPQCNAAKLKKERAAGVSATALTKEGCGLLALKAAGFSAGALRAAGFSARQLKAAGFTVADLKAAGFTAADLKAIGFSAAALKAAGFTASELKSAGFNAGELKAAGFTAGQLKNAGFSAGQLKNAGFSAADLKGAGFTAAELKNAGFTAGQLVSAGFNARELHDAGFTAAALRDAGVSAAALHDAGYSAGDLLAAGFTKGDLLRAGYAPIEAGYPEASQSTAQEASTMPTDIGKSVGALPPIGQTSEAARLAQFEKAEQASMNAQQRADHIRRTEAVMSQMAQKLLTAWSNSPTQQYQKAPEEQTMIAGESGEGSSAGATSSSIITSTENEGEVFKAGTVLFAVIETAINSNENTPIMAHIVSGPLNGSKLMGTFARQHKSLLITFTVLSDPRFPRSMPINAVAIDPDTARTALSGDVNSHYLLRYGSLFAASFLQGISQAVMNNGVSSDCLFGGFGCTLKQTPLNTNQQIAVGLGQMGQAYSQHMGQNFNLPPTVRIPSGTGIGVLLMGDLTLPKRQ